MDWIGVHDWISAFSAMPADQKAEATDGKKSASGELKIFKTRFVFSLFHP